MQSGNRLSPEELKRRNNLPSETLEAQTETTPAAHPTAEERQELRGILWSMGEMLGTQTVILEELSNHLSTLTVLNTMGSDVAICRSSLEQMHRDTETIRKLLEREAQEREQAGKKNGRHFSPRWPSVPLAPFQPGWLFLPLGLALLLAVLCCVLRLWTNGAALT